MNAKDTFFYPKTTLNCSGKLLDVSEPVVMGILNLTPDSFYDGGKNNLLKESVSHVEKMLSEGAAIIDIGAVSTKPNANEVNKEEEQNRLFPVLNAVIKEFPKAIFSVDTFRSEIANEVIANGAHIINDISGGADSNMFSIVAKNKAPYVLMHMQGTPATMQKDPSYNNVVTEVYQFFQNKIVELKNAGVVDIIIDPGFGFGKTVEHNYALLKELNYFNSLDCIVLAGVSRKSMINKVLDISAKNALNGTTAVNTIVLLNGAKILRVHDVKEAMEAIKIVEFYKKS